MIMGNCWSRFRIMGNCWPCWPIFESSESTNPLHPASTPPSPPTMESSQPSRVDSVGSPPLMDAIETLRKMCQKEDPVEQIDPLISFVENQLQKMTTPSEAGSSSSEGWLATVRDSTNLAEKIIDTISTEAEKLSNSDAVKAVGSLTLNVMKEVGDLYWVFIGLSVAAYAVENYLRVASTEKEWKEILVNILELAKEVTEHKKRMSGERERLCDAVGTIVEGAVLFCDYLKRGEVSRFWSATIATAQLEKINQEHRDLRDFVRVLDLQPQDVFLSHSGKQKNFVRQLHRDLTRENVSCFFDEDRNSLPLAQKFPPLMLRAAETCKIAVVVLSKEFIRSKWPMIELSTFISAIKSKKNAKLEIIPIFFNISPRELSRITKDNPEWQNLGVSNDTRGKWQDALKEVRSINGLPFSENGNEVDCRDEVVKKICCFLRGIKPPMLLEFEPVGIEEQVLEVKKLLDMEGAKSSLAVVVCGFGGVGKSTLAASVVESLDWFSTDFKFCMVAIDEKTQEKTSHIINLQKYIIYKLQGVMLDIQYPLDGRLEIKKALKNKCSLLFIDNVVDKDYIRELLPQDLRYSDQQTKLRIIITSREKNVKAELNIFYEEYEMKGLSDADSKSLFLKTILQRQVIEEVIDEDEKSMINEVASACKGVPLLLSVFGKHLSVARNKDSYQEALDVLRKGNLDSYREEDLGTKLMFVYDKIQDVEVKEGFLDICTYFHGWEWNLVVDIVDFAILDDLDRRSLVSKSCTGEVIVHDILRLMGMKKAGFTRFLNYKELSDALEDNLVDFENVKGISLVNDTPLLTSQSTQFLLIRIQSTQLEAMHKSLRVLMLGDWVTLDGPLCHRAFKNLRYLCLGDITTFPFKDPSKLPKLRVFLNRSKPGMNLSHLPSSLKRISHQVPHVGCQEFAKLPFQNLSSLKSFIVQRRGTQKSVKLPKKLHLPVSLIHLNLRSCMNLPKDIGHLTAVESLILDGSDLKCLPQGFGKLKKLKHLSVDYCSKLTFLSDELGMLSSLETFSMKCCVNLKALPKSLGELVSLKTLDMKCSDLQLLPESFGELCISSLELESLRLNKLPNSFGNMPRLKDLSLESCRLLVSLPDSFVQLKMLETLEIIECTQLSILPKDFGRLRYLKHLTVEGCHHLTELPHGFGALPSLKTFKLKCCNGFVNLPRDFTELTTLEDLRLVSLPLISRIPDGFVKLKSLRLLFLKECLQLKTLSDDFENMATLERLRIRKCPQLKASMMEKILKLQNCSMADIKGSNKLIKKWKQMQSEIEHPIAVFTGRYLIDSEVERRAIMVALLKGKCVEVNISSGQLMERSSLLVGLGEGTTATVAVIILPIQMRPNQHQTLQRFVEMARETAKTNGSSILQIVCARKYVWTDKRPTPIEEEERAEEENIRQILLSMPKGSCALSKRVKILKDYGSPDDFGFHLMFFIGHVLMDTEGRHVFENFEAVRENDIVNVYSETPYLRICSEAEAEAEDEDVDVDMDVDVNDNSIQNFIDSICDEQSPSSSSSPSPSVAGQSKTREFIKALKGNGIHHLLIEGQEVMVDDLHGKTIGFIICDLILLEWIKLAQIYKDIQQNSNFIAISIPTHLPQSLGHGSYTRVSERMPWATISHPHLVEVFEIPNSPRFVVLDKEGHIGNQDAWGLLLGWGLKFYPFTPHSIRESFFKMESESLLESLLHGMNIVWRKPMKSKMTFLYAAHPSEWVEMKNELEQLTQIHGDFEVLYVGKFPEWDVLDIEHIKQEYEDATQNMHWLSLSVPDWIMFWNRCKYFSREEGSELYNKSKRMMETLQGLVYELRDYCMSLILLDNDGPVTFCGYDVLQMICEPSDEISNGERMVKDELMKSLSIGECSPIVKTFFRDEIDNHPQHAQHRLSCLKWAGAFNCNVCFSRKTHRIGTSYENKRSYRCAKCRWYMCGSCWMTYAKQQA